MANKQRLRFGDPKGVHLTAADALAIAIGDLVYVDTTIKRAEDLAWDTDLATTQETFHDTFAGVAMDARRASHDPADPTVLRVATEGVFEYPCADSSTYAIGDLVGPAKQSGNALESQKVVKVANATLAIGRIERIIDGTTLYVRIESSLMSGGTQAVA